MTHALTLRLDDATYQRLRKQAYEEIRPISDIIREELNRPVPKAPTPTREALTAWLREGGRWETIRAKDEHDAARALLASDLWEGRETL